MPHIKTIDLRRRWCGPMIDEVEIKTQCSQPIIKCRKVNENRRFRTQWNYCVPWCACMLCVTANPTFVWWRVSLFLRHGSLKQLVRHEPKNFVQVESCVGQSLTRFVRQTLLRAKAQTYQSVIWHTTHQARFHNNLSGHTPVGHAGCQVEHTILYRNLFNPPEL